MKLYIPLKNSLVQTVINAKEHKGIESLTQDSVVRAASQYMRAKKVSSVVVMNDGQPVGIITERDINNAVADQIELDGATLDQVMTKWNSVSTISARATIGEAEKTMIEKGVRHLPVVDNKGNLVAMLSMRDVNNAYYRNEERYESEIQ